MAETEQLATENLQRAQKSQKAYYDTKCHGQRFQVGDRVWYRNRAKAERKKFLKPWCGPWKVVKVLSDVTYRIEEEIRKAGRRRQRRIVHFNYLKSCHSPPQETLSPTASLRRSQEPDQMQRNPVGSGEVELEWLENPASPVTEALYHPEVLVGNDTPILQFVTTNLRIQQFL